jgi:hypothetical protein
VSTPSDIAYETPSVIASTPSNNDGQTPRAHGEPLGREIAPTEDGPRYMDSQECPLVLSSMITATRDPEIGRFGDPTPEILTIPLPGPLAMDRSIDGHREQVDGDIQFEPGDEASGTTGSLDANTNVQTSKFEYTVHGFERLAPTQLSSGQEEMNRRLRAAARNGSVCLVQRLLSAGVDISEPGTTALLAAALYEHVDVARLLIEAGTDVGSPKTGDKIQVFYTVADTRDIRAVTRPRPIHRVTLKGHLDTVRLLLDENAKSDSEDGSGEPTLLLAIYLNLAAFA